MFESIAAEYIGGGLLLLTVYLIGLLRPIGECWLSAWWRRCSPKVSVVFAAAWRKALIVLTLAWSAGGLLAYGLTSGMDDAAPLWALCWLGSVSLALWGCAAWQGGLAVRWAVRHTLRLMA